LSRHCQEAKWHGTTDYQDYGMVLICSLYGGAFWKLFDLPSVTMPFETVLGEGCIVYAYTSSSMPPGKQNYSSRIHVDCPRLIPGYVTNMGATILLSDFTEENGATYFCRSLTNVSKHLARRVFQRSERLVRPRARYFLQRSDLAYGRKQYDSSMASCTYDQYVSLLYATTE
jgi:hypothetical protein